MTRPGPYLQSSRCRRCGAPTAVANRDWLADVAADVEVDPVVLDGDQRAACVVTRRPTWRVGVEGGRWLAGTGHWAAAGRLLGPPDDVVPAHRCGLVPDLPRAGWYAGLDAVRHAYEDLPLPF